MQCPVCPTENLVMTDRQGIEIDYCPKCRGVWLDRGELDKIIERSVPQPAQQPQQQQQQQYARPDDRRDGYKHSGGYGYHKKKKSFIGELFDF